MIKVANAPCSWGVLEFEDKAASPGYAQVLDEIASDRLCRHRARRLGLHADRTPGAAGRARRGADLGMVGAFVTTRLVDSRSYRRAASAPWQQPRCWLPSPRRRPPVIVLSDEPTADPHRARAAGRVTPNLVSPAEWWEEAADGINQIARAVRDETGLRTVFHHHCATFVETPQEIDALMQPTDPALVGLCLDTGHATYGGGSPLDLLERHRDSHLARPLQGLRAGRRRARAPGGVGLSDGAAALACSASWEGLRRFPALLRIERRATTAGSWSNRTSSRHGRAARQRHAESGVSRRIGL